MTPIERLDTLGVTMSNHIPLGVGEYQRKRWLLVLRRDDYEKVIYAEITMGSALKEPTREDLVHCLLTDFQTHRDYRDIGDIMTEFGSDYQEARRLKKGCKESAKKLKALFSLAEIADLEEAFQDY